MAYFHFKALLKITLIPISSLINYAISKLNLFIIWRFGSAVGDQFMMLGAVNALKVQYNLRSIVLTNYPDFFRENPNVFLVLSFGNKLSGYSQVLCSILKCLSGSNVANFSFTNIKYPTIDVYMKSTNLNLSLWELHTQHWKKSINKNAYKNIFYYSEEERLSALKKFTLQSKKYSLINPISKTNYTPNKGWEFEKFQGVVKSQLDTTWVQVGNKLDKSLLDCIDLRGKTNIRELCILVANSQIVLSCEGLLNHLASSFDDVSSVVIMSGYSSEDYIRYSNTIFIRRKGELSCAPCWLNSPCLESKKFCTTDITENEVVLAIRNVLEAKNVRYMQKSNLH